MKNIATLNYSSIQKELVRKGIHMTIAFVPTLSLYNKTFTVLFLLAGTIFYLVSEFFRSNNRVLVGFVTKISEIASRERDNGLTLGPVTLALGVLLTITSFNPVAAACGIYALAFGDGLSSVTGKYWGRVKIPFTNGKSFVGFFTCFTMILSTSYGVTGSIKKALVAALVGSIVELIPVKDVDNLFIPVAVALVVTFI